MSAEVTLRIITELAASGQQGVWVMGQMCGTCPVYYTVPYSHIVTNNNNNNNNNSGVYAFQPLANHPPTHVFGRSPVRIVQLLNNYIQFRLIVSIYPLLLLIFMNSGESSWLRSRSRSVFVSLSPTHPLWVSRLMKIETHPHKAYCPFTATEEKGQ